VGTFYDVYFFMSTSFNLFSFLPHVLLDMCSSDFRIFGIVQSDD